METRKVSKRELLSIFYISISILLCSCGIIEGTAILSPSGVAPVCSGGQLELTCTVTGDPLQWRFSVIRGNETIATEIRRSVNPIGPVTSNLTVNSIVFNFSRISAHGSMPVMSRLVISPVSNSLNRTVMNCVDVESGDVASTTIIVGERGALQDINVREQAAELDKEDVTVILEWDELNSLHSINVSVIPETRVNISSSMARLTMAYNVTYNVSVMVSRLCEQNSVTVFTEAYYYDLPLTTHNTTAICESLEDQLDDSVIVIISNTDLIVEVGTTVMFRCPTGSVSNGPDSSKCMENGEWKPAPYKVNCSDTMMRADSQDLEIILGCSLGIIFGMAIIITITVIAGILIKARFKVSTTMFYKRAAQHGGLSADTNAESSSVAVYDDVRNHNIQVTDVQTSRLVYADIGQTTFNQQKHLLPGISDLDDTPTEYAKINHNASVKPLKSPNIVKNNDTPSVNLDNLLIQLRPQISAKWHQFGVAAGIKKEVLDNFSKNCAPNDCIIEMLDYWLRNSTIQPTWNDVAGVLKLINYSQLAGAIESVYITGKLPVEVDMDWVPQTTDHEPAETESPPPIPPKVNEIASFDAPQNGRAFGFNQSANATVLSREDKFNDSAPVLPPKPKCGQMMADAAPPRPPRF